MSSVQLHVYLSYFCSKIHFFNDILHLLHDGEENIKIYFSRESHFSRGQRPREI